MRQHSFQLAGRYLPAYSALDTRERYNPLPNLTPEQAVSLYNMWREGKYADVQFAWDALEEFDDVLGTLVDRRLSSLSEMDFSVSVNAEAAGDDKDMQALADEQKQALSEIFARIDNLTEAIEFLGTASFRGYAHLEILTGADSIHLAPVDQHFWARPQRRGAWYYNPEAASGFGDLQPVDTDRLIIRECQRPIDIVALFACTIKAHAEAGWDGFIDVFGNPALFFELPPNTSDEKAEKYDEIMARLLGDGRGSYPNGGKIVPVESQADGSVTFETRADFANKKMVLRATGGTLTSIAESGSGTLAGGAQMDVYQILAKAEGRKVSELLTRRLANPWLDKLFPGQPRLAYWTLAGTEPDDVVKQITNITSLATAGYRATDEAVSEVLGLEVTSANLDPTALYAVKSVGYRPEMAPLEQRVGLPLENVPPPADGSIPAPALTNVDRQAAPSGNDEPPLTASELAAIKSLADAPLSTVGIAKTAESIQTALKGAMDAGMVKDPKTKRDPCANPVQSPN